MRKLGWAFLVAIVCAANAAEPVHLDQNWSEDDWQWFYTTPQGSKLVPYAWAMALERANDQTLWARNLDRFWFLPNRVGSNNPDGLPVGIVRDGAHLGLTCAACHTNQVEVRGTTYQIDGAPTNADLFAFLADLAASLNATAKSAGDPKFVRFAERVGGDPATLFADLKKFNTYFQQYMKDSTPDVAKWGRARTDAFGMIFNRVTSIDLKLPGNSVKPNAPVSYPFLWDTSWHNVVQWNGSAPNRLVVERLSRNVGEVLGVFADIDLMQAPRFPRFYPATAKRLNLLEIEDRLSNLRSPKWQTAFGAIDEAARARGQAIYNEQCISCHKIATPGKSQDVVMTALSRVKTDDAMAKMAATRIGSTGVLKGRSKVILNPFSRFGDKAPAGAMTLHAIIGAILSLQPIADPPQPPGAAAMAAEAEAAAATDDMDDAQDAQRAEVREELKATPATTGATTEEGGGSIASALRTLALRPESLRKQKTTDPVLEYKARPLDGIWATAPYLHNGSVPTLRDLLNPVEQRPKTFHVGSRELDTVNVGFVTTPVAGSFLFDTSIAGNRNTGHLWGTTLGDDQKMDLIAYLKSL